MKYIYALIALLFAITAFASEQDDLYWKRAGLPYDWTSITERPIHTTTSDGKPYSYYVLYSPLSITHKGDLATITYKNVYNENFTPTAFLIATFNCSTRQVTLTVLNVHTNPPTQTSTGELVDVEWETAGSVLFDLACR